MANDPSSTTCCSPTVCLDGQQVPASSWALTSSMFRRHSAGVFVAEFPESALRSPALTELLKEFLARQAAVGVSQFEHCLERERGLMRLTLIPVRAPSQDVVAQ